MGICLKKRLLLEKPRLSINKRPLWVHCASVGEFNTFRPILQELKRVFPIVLTYFSPRAKDFLESRKEFYDLLFPLPVDTPFTLRKFEKTIKPRALIIVERELWPFLLSATEVRKVLVNAYAKGGLLERLLISRFSLILTRTEEDRETFLKEGAKRVLACGNLKLVQDTSFEPLEIRIPKGFKTIVAGSTHRGEEEVLLRAYIELSKRFPLKMIIAPRHISRAEEVLTLAQRLGLSVSLRSSPSENWDILVLDTLGELKGAYALGDLCFVGGTLVKVGGHNLLEPAFLGKPVVFGGSTHKVKDLRDIVFEEKLGYEVRSYEELLQTFGKILETGFEGKGGLSEKAQKVKECYLRNILGELE